MELITANKMGLSANPPPSMGQTSMSTQDEEFKNKVFSCLRDIEKADPLEYRRLSVELNRATHYSSVTIDDLREIARLQDVLSPQSFTSHRRILGPWIVLYKKIAHRFFRKWLKISLGKQLELNQRFLNLAISVHVLENRVHILEKNSQGRA